MFGLVLGLVFTAVFALFVWFAWKGHNWSRIVLWVLAGLGWSTAVAVVALVRGRSWFVLALAAVQLAVASAAWLRWNKRYEGRVLVTMSVNHGVTVGDLLVVPAAFVGLALLVRLRRA